MDTFNGFQPEDFHVFSIDGLEQRMEAIKTRIRPKLEYLGQYFAPSLSAATGDEMFYHVAKHARRTVNPPNDTWVAWAGDKRGYKKHPHFQVGLWNTHLFIWYALIYESPSKQQVGQLLEERLDQLLRTVPDHFHWSPDHTQPDSIPQAALGREGVLKLLQRLQTVKKAELLCGITINRDDPLLTDGPQLLERIQQTFSVLAQIYNMAKPTLSPAS